MPYWEGRWRRSPLGTTRRVGTCPDGTWLSLQDGFESCPVVLKTLNGRETIAWGTGHLSGLSFTTAGSYLSHFYWIVLLLSAVMLPVALRLDLVGFPADQPCTHKPIVHRREFPTALAAFYILRLPRLQKGSAINLVKLHSLRKVNQ